MSAVRAYFCQLNRSFASLHASLGNRRVARWVLVSLLSIHTVMLGYSAYVHSPTLNEPGHLVAGLSYWKFGRFDVYSVNPPLVKLVAALPVMAVGYKEDWSGFYSGPGARPEKAMGEDFVTANGERTFFLLMIARWACIPFSWIGAIVCFLWGKDLYSQQAGILAASIWCFEPNIVAHASLITADIAGAALGVSACYTFWIWLKKPTWGRAVVTGVVLGLAELTKSTLILFYPLWPLLWFVYRWRSRERMLLSDWCREAGMLGLRMGVGLYVLNLGYGFEGSCKQLNDFTFVSNTFKEIAKAQDSTSDAPDNRCIRTLLRSIPIPLPQHYLVGIDLQRKDFEHYGHSSYLRGVWRNHGWWYYYIYGCMIKVPLGLLVIGVIAVVLFLAFHFPARSTDGVLLQDELLLFLPAVSLFVFVSSQTGFSEHFRYVLPVFPFCFIWLAGNSSRTVHFRACGTIIYSWKSCRLTTSYWTTLVILGCWFVASGVFIYPHNLSFFNESVGGPRNGMKHLLGSNLDWGQDILYCYDFLDQHKLPKTSLVMLSNICASTAAKDRDHALQLVADKSTSLLQNVLVSVNVSQGDFSDLYSQLPDSKCRLAASLLRRTRKVTYAIELMSPTVVNSHL